MKRILIILSLIAFTFVLSNNTLAQGCDAPSSDEGVQVFGYVQAESRTYFTEEPTSSFAFRRARLGVMGNIPYDFSYYVLLETSPFMSPETKAPFLLDAFISYTRYKYFKVSVGSFKYRFGNELSMPCNGLYTINRSKSVDVLTGGLTGKNRDIGIMFLGGDKSTKLQYFVSLTNGYGLLKTDSVNLLDAYALSGRVVFQPIEGLSLGASYRKMINPPMDASIETGDVKNRFGFDAQYKFRELTIIGEYIHGVDDGSYMASGGGCGGDAPVYAIGTQTANAFYGTLAYKWRNFEPVYKLENYLRLTEKEGGITSEESDLWQTIGLNYYPNDWTRIQLNYLYKAEKSDNILVPAEVKNDALLIQLQVKF
ncbi:MAG: porin [Bacteroidota bacterium]